VLRAGDWGVAPVTTAAAAVTAAVATDSRRKQPPPPPPAPHHRTPQRVMRIPLIPSREVPTWDSAGGAPFLATLKSFAPDAGGGGGGLGGGNNALFVRGEFLAAANYDRLYGAVNLLGDRSGGGGSTVLAHVAFRVDPRKDGGLRRVYVQGYKLGFWQTSSREFAGGEAASPITTGRDFWWRLVAHPTGFASYVDGALVTVSLPPPGQERLIGADATHAWVLLWCGPTRGWIGLDPTNGIWMAGDHIVMAIGRDYAEIAPIDGIVLGSGAQKMDVSVDVAPVEERLV